MNMSDTVAGGIRVSIGLVALCALFLSTLLGGCGYKTMPVPPQEIVPAAITDLQYELDEKGVTLGWTYPARTVRGDRLEELSDFQLYRAVVPAGDYCDTCPIPFGEPVQISGGTMAAEAPKTMTYRATLLRPGHLYFFKVRSRAGWWAESEDSNIVSFMWNIPPGVPAGLEARAGDSKVTLTWQPVTQHMDKSTIKEPVNYQVYRSLGGGPFLALGDLQDKPEYTDSGVLNGRKYQYKVQAVTMYTKGQVGGGITPSVEAIPAATISLTPPTGIQGIRTAAGVKMIWNPVEGKKVAGYRIYRRAAGEERPVLIGEVDVPTTIFDDRTPPDAPSWFYSVSSVNNADPVNESAASPEVEVLQ